MKKNKLIEFASAGLPRSTIKISNGINVKIRSMAVKELKLLMMAYTSETAQDEQVIQVLAQCIETPNVSVADLPSHDVELLYIELYKLSKGTHLVPVKYTCNSVDGDGVRCGSVINSNINLNSVTVDGMPDTVINLTNGLTLNMRFPTIAEISATDTEDGDITPLLTLATTCIVSVDTGSDLLIVGEDLVDEEIMEVFDYLDESSLDSIIKFASSIPRVSTKFPLKCPKCGHEEIIELRGLTDFFD